MEKQTDEMKKKTISQLKYFTCIEIDSQKIYFRKILENYEQFLESYEQLMKSYEQLMKSYEQF